MPFSIYKTPKTLPKLRAVLLNFPLSHNNRSSCPLVKPVPLTHDTMSSQNRRADEEATGRAEEARTDAFNQVHPAWSHCERRLINLSQALLRRALDGLLQSYPHLEEQTTRYLTQIMTLEEQIKNLRSDIERLNSENEKLRAKPSSEDGASISFRDRKDSLRWLADELRYVYNVSSTLDLSLEKRSADHRELPSLCGMICDEEQLADLKIFMANFASSPFQNGCFFCLRQAALGFMAPMITFGEDGLRCQAHGDDDSCVWISKREGRWVVGTSRG